MQIRILVLAGAVMLSGGVQMRAQMSEPLHGAAGWDKGRAGESSGRLALRRWRFYRVTGAAKAMPADKYSFAPAQGIFATSQRTQFDTVRTFVAQVTHLAQANYFFFGWSGIKPGPRDKGNRLHYNEEDEAVAALEACRSSTRIRRLRRSRQKNAFVAIKPIDGFSTRVTIAAFAAASRK